jgi:hypothetical protein
VGASILRSRGKSGSPITFHAEPGAGADALQPTPCSGFRARLTAGVRFQKWIDMPFFIKQVSSHGTSNPIFARLSVQTHELIQLCSLCKAKKDEVFRILHDDVQPRLLTCDDIAKAVVSEIEAVMSQMAAEGLKTQAQGRVFEVPHVISLEERVERYLYAAKSALRDAAKLFNRGLVININQLIHLNLCSKPYLKYGALIHLWNVPF